MITIDEQIEAQAHKIEELEHKLTDMTSEMSEQKLRRELRMAMAILSSLKQLAGRERLEVVR